MRILVVEDEDDLRKVLTLQLQEQGYSVDSCGDGAEAEDYLGAAEYDVVILDVILPKVSGMEVLRWARNHSVGAGFLMLTALDGVQDKVTGLDAGADDYMTKPFSFEELLARIRVLIRLKNNHRTNVYQVDDLVLDSAARTVKRGERPVMLSKREFALLEYMIANKGTVLSRNRIENHILDFSYEGASNLVDVYIRYLRKKIDEGFEKKLICTVRGQGYVLREE